MRSKFFATHIRHRLGFRALARLRRPLMGCMVLPSLVASLMPPIRPSLERGLLALAAVLGAVALASIVRPAHVESPAASTALQREDHELVHPARKDENWTTTSAISTVLLYWLSIRRLYTRVQAPTWTLLRFSALGTYRRPSSAATSSPLRSKDWPDNS
jgi:hypothetical protein